jgi:hypothetical protein
MDKKKKTFVINTLRRASYRWPSRWEAEKRSKIGRNHYKCEYPGCTHEGPKKDFAIDHVLPVVDPVAGFTTFDEYIDRMFPTDATGWQRLCHPHHDEKTKAENGERKVVRAKKKKVIKAKE